MQTRLVIVAHPKHLGLPCAISVPRNSYAFSLLYVHPKRCRCMSLRHAEAKHGETDGVRASLVGKTCIHILCTCVHMYVCTYAIKGSARRRHTVWTCMQRAGMQLSRCHRESSSLGSSLVAGKPSLRWRASPTRVEKVPMAVGVAGPGAEHCTYGIVMWEIPLHPLYEGPYMRACRVGYATLGVHASQVRIQYSGLGVAAKPHMGTQSHMRRPSNL